MRTWFSKTWHYHPPQHKYGLEINRKVLSCRLFWLKLQHTWPRSNIQYEIISYDPPPSLDSTGNASNKKCHLRLIIPICLSLLTLKGSPSHENWAPCIYKYKESRKSPKNTHIQTQTHTHTNSNNNNKNKFNHRLHILMTSESRVYTPYPLGTIINWYHMKT